MILSCPNCRQKLHCSDENIGKRLACPNCKQAISAPEEEATQDSDVEIAPSREKKNATKYCVECGEPIRAKADFCPKCGCDQDDPPTRGEKHCWDCGELIRAKDMVCPECGSKQNRFSIARQRVDGGNSQRMAAGLCGILLGGLGVHKFILGYAAEGTIMLVSWVVGFVTGMCCFFPMLLSVAMSIIGMIEGIIYLTKTDDEFLEVYQDNKRGWF